MKQISLSELSLELGVNKSKLAYYYNLGLIKPVDTVGRMQIFDYVKTKKDVQNIEKMKKEGKSLREMVLKMGK